MTRYTATVALALISLAGPFGRGAAPLAAQIIEGEVLAHDTGEPLHAVELTLLDPAGEAVDTTLSDSAGEFRLEAPEPGVWRVAAELIGRGRVVSDSLQVDEGRALTLEIRMAVAPVQLDEPVVVVAEWSTMSPDIADFHRRRQRGERTGIGDFFHGEKIERRLGSRPTDLLRELPGVRVARSTRSGGQVVLMRGGCVPAIFIDGSQINRASTHESLDQYVSLQSIEGIEVYRGPQQPGGRFFDANGCGVILVWTKRGYFSDGPFPWGKMLVGLALVAVLLVLR